MARVDDVCLDVNACLAVFKYHVVISIKHELERCNHSGVLKNCRM